MGTGGDGHEQDKTVMGRGHDSDEAMPVGGAEAPSDSTAKVDEWTVQVPNRGKT